MKSYKGSSESPVSHTADWTQTTIPGGHLLTTAAEIKDASQQKEQPNHRLGPWLSRTAPIPPRTDPPAHITKVPPLGPGGTFTTVTATASVMLALHPPLPGSCRGYTHEGFESDSPEEPVEDPRDSLELQNLNQRH